MPTVRVKIPATSANLGPGLHSVALALGLHNIVEVSDRESGFKVRINAEADPDDRAGITAAILTLLGRYFRYLGRAPSGLDVSLDCHIPRYAGLGSLLAIEIGTLLGVNMLLGSPLGREALIDFCAEGRADGCSVVAAIKGGLIAGTRSDKGMLYANLPIALSPVGIVCPEMMTSIPSVSDEQLVSVGAAKSNLGHLALSLQALATGDVRLLAEALVDSLYQDSISQYISGYEQAAEAVRGFPEAAMTINGMGPSLIVFASRHLDQVIDSVTQALRHRSGREVSQWIIPVDTQGVTMSVAGGLIDQGAAPVPVHGADDR